jgi:putative nucleotide binding protein
MTTTHAPHTTDIKEQYAYILDYLPNGYSGDTRPIHLRKPLAQALGADFFILLELSIKEGERVEIESRVFVGKGERDIVKHVERRLKYDELTHTAKIELPPVIENIVKENEAKYVEFYNNAQPITTRLHMLELLPGIGKKMMWAIIDERKKGRFKSFHDIEERVKGLHHPDKLIAKRIEEEIKDESIKYRLFAK